MFDPKTKKYPYPEYTDQHYIKLKRNDGTVFDKNYPFIDESKSFKFKRFFFRLFYYYIALPVSNIRLGLRVKGRKNLKIHKETINNGIISCCNHVHYWDYLGISYGIRRYKPHYLVWDDNIRGSLGGCMRLVGGIPIPTDDISASVAFSKAIKKHLNNGGWLHIYPEGSMWEYYKPIRPFKRGVAAYSVKFNKPILPLAYRYRKPNWIRRNIFKQIATFNLYIGEPIFPNLDLPKKEQEIDLTIKAHHAVCRLAGINPEDNIYPEVFDNTKQIIYY